MADESNVDGPQQNAASACRMIRLSPHDCRMIAELLQLWCTCRCTIVR